MMNVSNPELQLAHDYVEHTNHNIYLTGKAGTGKTTFLHNLKQNSPKRMIVTAPTGVAAINAGGVTLHSFFQIPFTPFVSSGETNKQIAQLKFNKEKINIIKSLDLLVIDEISMVRADILDFIDAVLRHYKQPDLPFGGIQLLMIGDLYQLSPVVRDNEWSSIKDYYQSYYFFSSHVLQQTDLITIELKHIYRQSDEAFIRLLNCVRDNKLKYHAENNGVLNLNILDELNSRYIPDFKPKEADNYITLTTHNASADQINNTHLHTIESKSFTFKASVANDYPESTYPAAEQLCLKQGSQVMFIRNDHSTEKRYFNGKTGKITYIDQHKIKVKCTDDKQEIVVERATWENIKYTINKETKEIDEAIIGEFTQYPLRLAWAITIHKSQGLTFERAIIDANTAFAHGQVYVALSRCKTFEGMVLNTPISDRAVRTDRIVVEFMQSTAANSPNDKKLCTAKILYQKKLLLECFDYQQLNICLVMLINVLKKYQNLIQGNGLEHLDQLHKQTFEEITKIGEKFKRELRKLFVANQCPEEDAHLQERVSKAAHYFSDKLQSGLVEWALTTKFTADNKEILKKTKQVFSQLQQQLSIKLAGMQSCNERFTTNGYLEALSVARINKSRVSSKNTQSDYQLSDLKYPQLFLHLKEWRSTKALEEKVKHYQILHQRVLFCITNCLPKNLTDLQKIKGIGKTTANKYGEALIGIVLDYCQSHDIQQPSQSDQELEKQSAITNSNTKQISYDLYKSGKSIAEIAEDRGLVFGTIEQHLTYFVGIGQLDITELVSAEKFNLIKTTLIELLDKGLKEVKNKLGDNCSYGEIRMVKKALESDM